MGTNTDPYQRCEGRYRLTRGVLEVLRDYANPCSVLTKSPLLLRDLDLFVELAETAGFSANLSIGTLDEEVWRRSEPGTPHPKARMAAVKQLVAAGIPCGILMAPILPGISDSPDQLRAVVRAAADAGASHLTPLTLHLRPGVKEEFMPWLEEAYPELVPDYQRLYRGSNAPKAVREEIAKRVRTEKRPQPSPPPPPHPPPAASPSLRPGVRRLGTHRRRPPSPRPSCPSSSAEHPYPRRPRWPGRPGPSCGSSSLADPSGRQGGAEGVGASDLWGALLVEDVEFGDGEACGCQQVDDRPGQVASAEDSLLHRLEASLPAADPLVGGQPVLDEVQGPAGLEDAPQFTKGGGDVGDGAHRPGGQGGVVAVVREGQRLAVQG